MYTVSQKLYTHFLQCIAEINLFSLQIHMLILLMLSSLKFEQRKFNLQFYWKHENVVQFQRWYRRDLNSDPQTRFTISRVKDNFEAGGTEHDVRKNHSRKTRISTFHLNRERTVESFQINPRKLSKY